MKQHQIKMLAAYGAAHHDVISREAALGLGITCRQIQRRVEGGYWTRMHRGVFHLGGGTAGPEARLLAACLAAGDRSAASHASASWLWGLSPQAPAAPAVSVPLSGRSVLPGVALHRRRDLEQARVRTWNGIPVTDPLRTLVDLGEVVGARELDDAVDAGLASQLVTVSGLEAELARLARPGRRGVPELRAALLRRSLVEAPHPSVLESQTLRLLRRWQIFPLGTEVAACDGRYRLDVLLATHVALEVDGYAYHWSPESKAADSRRRNELRLAGITVIESDWVTVTRRAESLRRMIVATLGMDARSATG